MLHFVPESTPFLRPTLLLTNIIRNDGELSGIAVLITQPLKYTLCRMTLLFDDPLTLEVTDTPQPVRPYSAEHLYQR